MDESEFPSGILTFLFTDIQGSTALWEKDPAGMRAALECHNRVLHASIKAHDGKVFKIIGDEFQAVFIEPAQAVEAAVAAQRALNNVSWDRIEPLRVRMGIHTGHAVALETDYEVSHTFNRTARIMSAGHGGQILLSVDVVDHLQGVLLQNVSLQDMGRQRMKGMTLREHIFQIIIADLPADFPPIKTKESNFADLADSADLVGAADEPLQITLLGEFFMRHNDQTLSLNTPSHQLLLAYLVIHAQRVHSRRQLAFQFWPDSTEAQARTNLRKALHTLRHTLPDPDHFLTAGRQTVQWQSDATCVVDVWQFESAVSQAELADDPFEKESCLEQANQAYQGDFMPGHYDDWALSTREQLRQQYLDCLEKLLLLNEEKRHYPAAISLARKLLREDPLNESAYRRLMRLQALDNNVAGAIRTYHTCSTRLQRDLGVNPSLVTQEVYEGLLQGQAAPIPLAPERLPLVAREEGWRSLQDMWTRCQHNKPAVVLLGGEAGIGKTRLAEEMLDWVERQGVIVLTAVCYPSEQQLAYAPVAKWLRGESLQPLFRQLDKRTLVECSRLLPELNNQYSNLPAPSPLTESWQRQHFFSALVQTLLKLRQPFLLFLDDLQWCDQDTLDWLLFLLHHDPWSRFLLMVTIRTEEVTPDHPLTTWQPQLDRDGRLTRIGLKRLDAKNSAQLAAHVLKKGLDAQQTKRLHAETEGNPLFVVEMARAGLSDAALDSRLAQLPANVQAVIESRLASLSAAAQELAQLAAVIGRSFTFSLLNQACIHSEDMVIHSLDELWQRRIVRERGVDAYDFTHEKIRHVAYTSLSPIRRRQIHQQVWQALETLHTDNLDQVSAQIASHCEAAGRYPAAIKYYQRAAKVAQAVYANRDTENYLQRTISLFSKAKTKPEQKIEIYQKLKDVLKCTGRYAEATEIVETALDLATDPWTRSELYCNLADVQMLRREYSQAHLVIDKAEATISVLPHTPPGRWWREWIEIRARRLGLYYFANNIKDMAALADEMNPIVEKYGSPLQVIDFYQDLALLGFRQARGIVSDEVVAYTQKTFEALKESGDINLVAWSHFFLAFIHLWHGWHGDLDEAEGHFAASLRMAEEMGNVLLRTRCQSYLAVLYRMRGDHHRVADLIPQIMKVAEEGDLQEYIAMAEGNLAWLNWLKRDLDATKAHGRKALAIWQAMPFAMPARWVAIWPLLDAALLENSLADAVVYAKMLLLPEMSRLPDELTAVLQQAIAAFAGDQQKAARDQLQIALQHARELNQL